MWMLEIDPDNRPTPKEALKHPWFKCDIGILKRLLKMNTLICTNEKKNPKRN